MRTFRSFFILNALLTLLLIFPSFSQGFEAPEEIFTTSTASSRKATVCLNMIVKDEKDVILRCLESVLPLIDYWVIVDTGSTDGTQELIVDFMNKKGVPGDLYERPWVNFGHNRNEALNLARNEADYLLFIDADEYLKFDPDFKTPDLKEDFYYLTVKYGGSAYSRVGLTKMSLDWRWKGVLHEALYSDRAAHSGTLEKVSYIVTADEGARSKDPHKYEKDAQVLEAALKEEPNNTRYVFYLAQSYFDAGNYPEALKNYEKRAEMGGWEEEVFYSLFRIAIIQQKLNMSDETVIASYYKAFECRKCRVEPLYYIAHYLRETKNDFERAYKVAKIGYTMPVPKDALFIYQWVYDYGIALELSVSAYWLGLYEESQKISLELLKKDNLPENIRTCVQRNLEFANNKLVESTLKEIVDNKASSDSKNL